MNLEVYTIEKSEEWDNIVMTFDEYDVYWLSGYAKGFSIHGDGEPLLFYYNDGNTRGINVVMKRDISQDKHFSEAIERGKLFDFSSVYGYGGWLIEGNETERLFAEYEKWCIKNRIVCEFVRFHPLIGNQFYSSEIYEIVPLGNTIAINLSSPELIWENFTSKNRNMIRKAKKNDVKIYNGRFPEIYDIFQKIYNATMEKDCADKYYYFKKDFYESILLDLSHNAQVFYAEYKGKIIATSIMVYANGRMNYHLSGSIKEYGWLAPTNLLLYEAALWGCMNGYKTLYLGGGVGSEEDSLYRFKKSFYRKEDLYRFYIGKKVFLQKEYDALTSIRKNDVNNFFPLYRACGDK